MGGNLTRTSIAEYAGALRPRYRAAGRGERGQILTEFCRTTGYHRKAAIRLLNREVAPVAEKRGRRRVYPPEVAEALARVWEASGRLCSKRLVPFLPELLAALERHGELAVGAEVRAALLRLTPATVDRLLAGRRRAAGRRPFTQSAALAALKAQVPVRTFGEWAGARPGEVQADLVAHCGETTEGFYLTSLTVVDVATGWSELEAVWGKGQERVQGGFHRARERFPFPLVALHTDNGGEFLNAVLYPYCRRSDLGLSRGRPYKKNDQAYVEQKNGAVVRRRIGYDRYASKAAFEQLQQLYQLVRLDLNYFQPVRKLLSKERVGSKVVKRFDAAQTPYQRIMAAGVLGDAQRERREREYRHLNPVRLRQQIEAALDRLWTLAEVRGAAALGAADGLLIARAVKQYGKRRVVAVAHPVVRGTTEPVQAALVASQGKAEAVINTAYAERLNATFRAVLAPLARRTRRAVHDVATLEAAMWLAGTCYNFCAPHRSLRQLPGVASARHRPERTPAMAANLTDHVWTVHELLAYPVPTAARPKRGRRPNWLPAAEAA